MLAFLHCAFQDGRIWQHILLAKPFQTAQSLRASKAQALSGQKLHRWPWSRPVLVGRTYSICSGSSPGASQLKLAGRAKVAKPLIRAEELLHICSHTAHSYQGKNKQKRAAAHSAPGDGHGSLLNFFTACKVYSSVVVLRLASLFLFL